MSKVIIRDTLETDLDSLFKANTVEVIQSSAMDTGRVQALHKLACHDIYSFFNNVLINSFIVLNEDNEYKQ